MAPQIKAELFPSVNDGINLSLTMTKQLKKQSLHFHQVVANHSKTQYTNMLEMYARLHVKKNLAC